MGAEERIAVALSERLVGTVDEARALRLPGTFTVHVGGRDVLPALDGPKDVGLG